MRTPSPLLPHSICGAGNSILKNEISHSAQKLVPVQAQTAMFSCCCYSRMQKLLNKKKRFSMWSLDTRKTEYYFPLSQSSGISTAGCKTQWWDQAVGDNACICVLLQYLSSYKESTGSLNEKSTVSIQIPTHSAHSQTALHGSALKVLDPALAQPFSLQIWRTTQSLSLTKGYCLCSALWISASHWGYINLCSVTLCFLYFLCYGTSRIKI